MKQLRETLHRYGEKNVTTSELVAFLLAGTSPKGEQIIPILRKLVTPTGIRRLRTMSLTELCHTTSLDRLYAERLYILCTLINRFVLLDMQPRRSFTDPLRAAAFLQPLMAHLAQEEFRVLVLDRKYRLVDHVLLYRGTMYETPVRAAEIFRPAIVLNASAVILCHNHPSGDSTPSDEDRQVTEELVQAGKLLDIELVDHVIIGNPKCVSLRTLLHW